MIFVHATLNFLWSLYHPVTIEITLSKSFQVCGWVIQMNNESLVQKPLLLVLLLLQLQWNQLNYITVGPCGYILQILITAQIFGFAPRYAVLNQYDAETDVGIVLLQMLQLNFSSKICSTSIAKWSSVEIMKEQHSHYVAEGQGASFICSKHSLKICLCEV